MSNLIPTPLDKLSIPVELNGQRGTNRAPASSVKHSNADNDLDIIQLWLAGVIV